MRPGSCYAHARRMLPAWYVWPMNAKELKKIALRHPDTDEGVACEGTALESRTYRAKKKAFLFVRQKDGAFHVRLKLDESKAAAAKLGHAVGKGGWALVIFAPGEAPKQLARWIDESYRIVSGQ